MSYRLVITDRALGDLRDIRNYVAKRSPTNAERFLERLLGEFDGIVEICHEEQARLQK